MCDFIESFKPFIQGNSKILILGSMPSVKSLEEGFYYANKQNRFFKIISKLYGKELINTEDKKHALISLNLALFDVIYKCKRKGSLDSAITDIYPTNISDLITSYPSIKRIITNGSLAAKLFKQYNSSIYENNNIEVFHLPSTSAANAKYSFDNLFAIYKDLLNAKNI